MLQPNAQQQKKAFDEIKGLERRADNLPPED